MPRFGAGINGRHYSLRVMPGLVPGIHAFLFR
jgi:hypothetical protein